MKTALVTGASGFLGSYLCQELSRNNYKVRAFCRSKSDTSHISNLENLEVFRGDLSDTDSVFKACEGVDVVFNIAALYRQAKFPDSAYWEVNHKGTLSLLNAACSNKVEKFIHCSTIGVHSDIKNPPANESEPYAPTDVYQESKVAGEKEALKFFSENKIKGCVIRPAMIWGPRDTRFLKFFKGIKSRRLPLIGDGEKFCHWIDVRDLAKAFRLASETDNTNGKVYIIAGERSVTLKHTMQTIADVYKVKLLPFHIPVMPFQIAGTVIEKLCKPFGIEPPIHRRRADFFIKNRAFDCSRAETDFNFTPKLKFEEEAKEIAEWYRNQGVL